MSNFFKRSAEAIRQKLRPWDPPLPAEWRKIDNFGPCGARFVSLNGLRVIASTSPHDDGNEWLHVSVTRDTRMLPSYADLCEVKRVFVGKDRKAIMVFPSEDRHVNIHEGCLHLWCNLGKDALPEFSGEIAPGVRSI